MDGTQAKIMVSFYWGTLMEVAMLWIYAVDVKGLEK